jgi:SH3-like domain-containing protein
MNILRKIWLTLFILMLCSTLAQARMVAVKTNLANIRETPKINQYNLFLQAPRHYPLRVISKKDDFLKVQDFKGQVGWVKNSVVSKTRAAVVKVKRANLRTGPGKNYGLALRAEQGVCFKVIKAKGNWLQLEHASGQKGWMHSSLLWGF